MAILSKIRHIIIFLTIVLSAIFVSCRQDIDNRLREVETVVDARPDSALNILARLDTNTLTTKKDRHIYDILLTEARYKSGINDTAVSQIAAAAKFFDKDIKSIYRLKAYYYNAILNGNGKKFGLALIELNEAGLTAEAIGDIKWKALVHRAQGDMFDATKNIAKALNYYTASLKEFSHQDSDPYYGGALYDCCRSYLNLQKNDSAIIFANRLKDWAEKNSNHHSRRLALACLGDAYYNIGEYNKTIKELEDLQNEYPDRISDLHLECLGLSYLNTGNMGKAEDCGRTLTDHHSPHLSLLKALAVNKGDYREAMRLMEISRQYNDSITKEWQTRTQDAILYENFMLENKNAELEKSQKDMWAIIVLILSVCLILAVRIIIISYKSRVKDRDNFLEKIHSLESDISESSGALEEMRNDVAKKQSEIREANSHLSSLHQEIEKLKSEREADNSTRKDLESKLSGLQKQAEEDAYRINELERDLADSESIMKKRQQIISQSKDFIEKTMGERYRTLDSLASRYYDLKGKSAERNEMFNEIIRQFENIRTDRTTISSFEDLINRSLDNLMIRFRHDFPKMSDPDRLLFMLTVLDFSPKAISIFLNIPVSRFYNRKSSLKNKISENHSIDSWFYLKFF